MGGDISVFEHLNTLKEQHRYIGLKEAVYFKREDTFREIQKFKMYEWLDMSKSKNDELDTPDSTGN